MVTAATTGGMRRAAGRRGGSARGRAIPLVGTVDENDTSVTSDATSQRGSSTVAQTDTEGSEAAAGEKQKRIKISFDGQGLFGWPETLDTSANLLSLQHNFISRLPDGLYLPALVLLDLYDNQLERMSGLRHLETLRVLVIARNRLRKIEGLEQLVHLEILDLHSNYISRMTGLETLGRLRVLNLSNNCVRTAGCLAGLAGLQQLNLRGNALRRVAGLEHLPRLVKLNLAHNDIRRPEDVECLVNCQQLEELSLSGAPVSAHPGYHPLMYRLKRLKLLDGMHVERGPEELTETTEPEAPRPPPPALLQRSSTEGSLRGGRRSARPRSLDRPAGGGGAVPIVARGRSMSAVRPRARRPSGRAARPTTGRLPDLVPACDRAASASSVSSRSDETAAAAATGSGGERGRSARTEPAQAELEIRDGCLVVSGDRALRLLTTWEPREAGQVRSLTFSRLEFDQLAPLLATLRERFPQAAALRLTAVRLSTLSQLNAISRLRELQQLTVEPEGNPVTQQPLWRPYAVYRLHHWGLRRINDTPVSAEEAAAAAAQFGPLGRLALCCLPESRLVELAEKLWFSDCRSKTGDAKPTAQQVYRRLADPRLQGIMEREALLNCPRRTGTPYPSLEEPLREAQRAMAALRDYRSLLPSLLRELSGAAAHQRRAGSASVQHEARALLDDLAADITS